MRKINTLSSSGSRIFKARQLTIGLDLGDRWSWYCVLNEVGDIVLERRLTTTPEAMKQV
jgi:transposase